MEEETIEGTCWSHHPLLNTHVSNIPCKYGGIHVFCTTYSFWLKIVEIIFKQCDTRTLLSCRMVCQTWNSEALRIMARDEVTALVKGKNAIENFLECMKTSDSQPFSSFSMELSALALGEQFQSTYDLIFLLKDRMTQVKFDYEMPTSSINPSELEVSSSSDNQIDDLLDDDEINPRFSHSQIITLPVLSSLQFFSTNIFPPKSPNRLPRLFDLLKTPHLTSLSVQHLYATECTSTIVKFLKNVESPISSLRIPCTELPKVVEEISNSGQLINLKYLQQLDICDLFHGSFATNETIRCIQENCQNLRNLSIELGIRVTFDAVFKLLEILSHSLKNLKLIIQDKNLLSRNMQRVNFYFPHMPKLESLFLRYANPGLVYFIEELPQLASLELETPWTRKVRGQIFPGVDSKIYTQLQTLNLTEKLTDQDVRVIRRLFPNLKTLCSSFQSNLAFQEVCQSYGDLLEVLIVDRNSSVTDTGICGLSQEDLSKFSLEGLSDATESPSKSIAMLNRNFMPKFNSDKNKG